MTQQPGTMKIPTTFVQWLFERAKKQGLLFVLLAFVAWNNDRVAWRYFEKMEACNEQLIETLRQDKSELRIIIKNNTQAYDRLSNIIVQSQSNR